MAKKKEELTTSRQEAFVDCPICGVSMEAKKSVSKGRWALSFVCSQTMHKVEVKIFTEALEADEETEG